MKNTNLKKNWRLQCLICSRCRKPNDLPVVTCPEIHGESPIYYGSDLFTGFIKCEHLDIMKDPFKALPRMGSMSTEKKP